MSDPKLNNGFGAKTDDFSRLASSRSPAAARQGNADPSHDGSDVQLGMRPIRRTDDANHGAAEHEGSTYKELYEPR